MWDRIARKLGRRDGEVSGPVEVRVCRVTWQYKHPPAALERETEADTSSFHAWSRRDPDHRASLAEIADEYGLTPELERMIQKADDALAAKAVGWPET